MPPKPFPFLLGVGVDIARIARFTRLLERGDQEFLRWARRVFTRLELPALQEQCRLWSPLDKSSRGPHTILQSLESLSSEDIHKRNLQQGDSMKSGLSTSLIKPFAKNASKEQDQNNLPPPFLPQLQASADSTSSGDTSGWTKLAQYISGRWAAKEAAIKAHRHRRLFYSDISIVVRDGNRPWALIRPATRNVVMDKKVAKTRGLDQFLTLKIRGPVVDREIQLSRGRQNDSKYTERRLYAKEEDYQVAELSISHDVDYAVAVCMALDQPCEDVGPVEPIFDDGSGEPIHEPILGDRGFIEDTQGPLNDTRTGDR
ncbi:MAG: hypothetical protein Q9214_003768, partial [Letrouitia sp. 1 TL-2023]